MLLSLHALIIAASDFYVPVDLSLVYQFYLNSKSHLQSDCLGFFLLFEVIGNASSFFLMSSVSYLILIFFFSPFPLFFK